jgi:hypothetical protein
MKIEWCQWLVHRHQHSKRTPHAKTKQTTSRKMQTFGLSREKKLISNNNNNSSVTAESVRPELVCVELRLAHASPAYAGGDETLFARAPINFQAAV